MKRATMLIVHPGALGDVLLSLPAIRTLRKSFPTYRLGLLAAAEVSQLLAACQEVDAAFPIEHHFLAELLAAPESLRGSFRVWMKGCALAVCWLADRDGRLRQSLGKAGVARIIMQSPGAEPSVAEHQENRFLRTLNGLSPGHLDCGARSLRLPSPVLLRAAVTVAGVENQNRPLVILHPGSGSRHKCTDPVLFAQAIEWCFAKGHTPLLVGGPADEEAVDRVLGACMTRPRVLQRSDLLSISGILVHSSLFVGHDSGLTHLAAQLFVRTVAIFGPTDPQRWAPRGTHVTILSGRICQCRGWEAVQACGEKPCLRIASTQLICACEEALATR